MKTFETFTDCHIKTCHLSNGRLFWKSLVHYFRRTYALSIGFKMKTPTKSVFECYDKNQLTLCLKSYWKKLHSFLLSIWWTRFSDICTIIELKELNWLCKHTKKSQKQPTLYFNEFCTEFKQSTSSSFMWVSLKIKVF